MANTLKLGAGKWATGTDTVLAFNTLYGKHEMVQQDRRSSPSPWVFESNLFEQHVFHVLHLF